MKEDAFEIAQVNNINITIIISYIIAFKYIYNILINDINILKNVYINYSNIMKWNI